MTRNQAGDLIFTVKVIGGLIVGLLIYIGINL